MIFSIIFPQVATLGLVGNLTTEMAWAWQFDILRVLRILRVGG